MAVLHGNVSIWERKVALELVSLMCMSKKKWKTGPTLWGFKLMEEELERAQVEDEIYTRGENFWRITGWQCEESVTIVKREVVKPFPLVKDFQATWSCDVFFLGGPLVKALLSKLPGLYPSPSQWLMKDMNDGSKWIRAGQGDESPAWAKRKAAGAAGHAEIGRDFTCTMCSAGIQERE